MPVSRGRKSNKKNKKNKTSGKKTGGLPRTVPHLEPVVLPDIPSLLGPPERPGWFDSSIKSVLDQAGVLMACRGPRELEQATAELLGAELHRVVHEERSGMWFDWWIQELAEAAAARVREDRADDGVWEGPWRMLHGLTSIGSPALRTRAQAALGHAKKALGGNAEAARGQDWLRRLYKITATGEVWEMHDAYGSRIAVIAGFAYLGGTDPSVFLFDIDACGSIDLVNAGVFDDVAQAAAAWRTLVGDIADGVRPSRVETPERLYCLVHWDHDEMVRGYETRGVMDNWFRARRREHDLADALRKRGMPLSDARSLFRDIDTVPMATAFTHWYASRHGAQPDPDAVIALAEEWLEGCLPGTEHAVSPHRVRYQLTLIGDWKPDHPITVGAQALMPDWVRWHGEEAGLPGHLIDRAVAATTAGLGATVHCGDVLRQL